MATLIERTCIVCGMAVLRPPALGRPPTKCSTKCRNRWQKTHRSPETVKRARKRDDAKRYGNFRAWSNDYKLSHGCTDCGYRTHPAALHFHHTGPKTRDVSQAQRVTRALAEIQSGLCIVLCANCHAVRTWTSAQETGEGPGHIRP